MHISKINFLIILICFFTVLTNCKKETCEYKVSCTPSKKIIDDFNDTTTNNWYYTAFTAVSLSNFGSPHLIALHTKQRTPGVNYLYNTLNYPENLVDSTCELIYDVAFSDSITNKPGGSTATSSSNKSLIIYNGISPIVYTKRADFILNPTHLINANSLSIFWNTVHVPLKLTSPGSTNLPSNSYGSWQINNHPAPYSITEKNDFDALIQSISGIGFQTGIARNDEYVIDNLKLKKCCP